MKTRPATKRPSTGRASPSRPADSGAVARPALASANGVPSPLAPSGGRWTFLTNHAHVLILLARNPSLVLREVAVLVGITERAVQRIIADLEDGGFLEREKVGRQNQYRIRREKPLRHPIESHRSIGDLIRLVDESR